MYAIGSACSTVSGTVWMAAPVHADSGELAGLVALRGGAPSAGS